MQCGMAPPWGKKRCICPSAIQTCAERLVPNTIMFSNVQLRYLQHIPGICSSMRLTYCQNIFGSKIAENYSIRGQRIRIFFQNNFRLWRNILKIRPHRRCWGVIFRMALVKGYRFTWGEAFFAQNRLFLIGRRARLKKTL